MSKLHYTESGRVIANLGEELTRFRRIRKVLDLPGTSSPATLYILARPHPATTLPLRLTVNGHALQPVRPVPRSTFGWYELPVDPALLRSGENVIELWCDSTAMNGWAIALEPGHATPGSAVTDDGGATWRNERMSYLSALLGEYVVRMRLADGEDPSPPDIVYEDPSNQRLESLRQVIPEAARVAGSVLATVRALNTWLASSWEHTNSTLGVAYAPWDAETILAWGADQCGHAGERPVAMCVHYGAAFVSSCQALGIPARCAVFADGPNGTNGHFTAEYWSAEHAKWVMADPNLDALFWRDGVPLSVSEIQSAMPNLGEVVEFGPGYQAQLANERIRAWVKGGYLEGRPFRHRAVWYRSDLLSHPELSPPGHGSVSYCETGLVFSRRDAGEFGMFPYFAGESYFDDPPPAL